MIKFGFVFLLALAVSALVGLTRHRTDDCPMDGSGPAHNMRLTALVGIVLYVLLIAIAVTVVDVRKLLAAHYLVGFVLIPPLLLKFGSTGYRLLRYYSGSTLYRLAGAPSPVLRFVVAPILVASTTGVFVSGVELWLFGLRFGSVWILAHTLSAVIMMLAVTAHLVAHMGRSAAVLADEPRTRSGALRRESLIATSLAVGGILAVASLLYASPFSLSIRG